MSVLMMKGRLLIFATMFFKNFLALSNDGIFLQIEQQDTILTGDVLEVAIIAKLTEEQQNTLSVWLHLESIGKSRLLGTKKFPTSNDKAETFVVHFRIPHYIVYFDSRNFENPTDYFAKSLKITACILNESNKLLSYSLIKRLNFPLRRPWDRVELPTYTPAWDLKLKTVMESKRIGYCKSIADVITLTKSQLAISGEPEMGFMRKIKPLRWPKHTKDVIRDHIMSKPRFTLTSWIYLLEYCSSDYCEMLSHRLSLQFLSPVVLINRKGHLHLQVHNEEGAGEAFVTNQPLPLRKWIHIVISIDGNQAQISVTDVMNYGCYFKYSHAFNSLFFKSSLGTWNIGGFYGFSGFHGMVCCVRLYRRKALQPEEIPDIQDDRKMVKKYDVPGQFKRCLSIRRFYNKMLAKYSNHTAVSTTKKFSFQVSQNITCPRSREAVTASRYVSRNMKATYVILEDLFRHDQINRLHDRKNVSGQIHAIGIFKMMQAPSTSTILLEIAGCLGHLESFFATSITKMFGREANNGHKSDSNSSRCKQDKTIVNQMYAAMNGDSLSQLALSYKHQIGLDGVVKDLNIAAGYTRAAAWKVKKMLEDEKQYIHTHSEMIRIDESHLYSGKRGISSDVMKWLKRQADWGSMTAQSQMADILFHGQHGVNAQRNEAVNLFRAGANQGDPGSMYNLGVLHLRGIEVEKNETAAIDLFEKAAKKDGMIEMSEQVVIIRLIQNFTLAFNSLGYHELVNKKNITGALHYWKLASDLGDKDATVNLGLQYENGVPGVIKANRTKALECFRKSAEQGQKDGCIKYGDYLLAGEAGEVNGLAAIKYYRYIGEQLPAIGLYLRNGLNSYLDARWNTSLLMYMLASETGLALGSFNTALLCDEMIKYELYVGSLGSNCSLYYHNISAKLGWPLSIIQMGDEYWYGDRLPINKTKAAINYGWVAQIQGSPQALYNLGFIIENNFSVDGIHFSNLKKFGKARGNLLLAKNFYERCQNSKKDNGDGYFPCTLALLNLKLKIFFDDRVFTVAFIGLSCAAILLAAVFCDDEIL